MNSTHLRLIGGLVNFKKPVESFWHVIAMQVSYSFAGIISAKVTQNGLENYAFNSWSGSMFYDNVSSITIGSSIESFKGFVYKLTLQNGIINETYYTNLLSTCPVFTFEENQICYNCSDTCKNGCKTCNLCKDPLCELCSDLSTIECYKCDKYSILINGSCYCINGTYWNQTTWKCEKCEIPCKNCLNLTICSTCLNNLALVSNSCGCIGNSYLDQLNMNCSICHSSCNSYNIAYIL